MKQKAQANTTLLIAILLAVMFIILGSIGYLGYMFDQPPDVTYRARQQIMNQSLQSLDEPTSLTED